MNQSIDNFFVNVGGVLHDFSGHKIMSIINITPDSFYEGSRVICFDTMLEKIENDLRLGAFIFDIGGYSSRPGAADVSEQEEVRRVIGAVERIRERFGNILLSIDTFRSGVIREVVENCGSVVVNDISAGEADDRMLDVTAYYNLPYIAMHMRGTPQNMNTLTHYDKGVAIEVVSYFHNKLAQYKIKGVESVILDPGFGFSKTVEQNFELLSELDKFNIFDNPLLVGVSRKSMIYKTLGIDSEASLNGTTALNWAALASGANILRVHDVKEAAECVKLFEALHVTTNLSSF